MTTEKISLDADKYRSGAWFGIGAFIASAAWALSQSMYVATAACLIGATLWYVGLRQSGVVIQ